MLMLAGPRHHRQLTHRRDPKQRDAHGVGNDRDRTFRARSVERRRVERVAPKAVGDAERRFGDVRPVRECGLCELRARADLRRIARERGQGFVSWGITTTFGDELPQSGNILVLPSWGKRGRCGDTAPDK